MNWVAPPMVSFPAMTCRPPYHRTSTVGIAEQQGHQRCVDGLQPGGGHLLVVEALRIGVELPVLAFLKRKGLDHLDAEKALLERRSQGADELLHLRPHRLELVAHVKGLPEDDRHESECHQRQSPVQHRQQVAHADNHDHDLDEVQQAALEEHAGGLDIDGRPRHDLAGLRLVIEGEAEVLQVVVEGVADIVRGLLRDKLGDVGIAETGGAPDDGGAEDDQAEEDDLALAPRADGDVDAVAEHLGV